jgi:hypothetical protein
MMDGTAQQVLCALELGLLAAPFIEIAAAERRIAQICSNVPAHQPALGIGGEGDGRCSSASSSTISVTANSPLPPFEPQVMTIRRSGQAT